MENLDLNIIQDEFKKALLIENKLDQFESLRQVAIQTDSSSLPNFMKDRINQAISNKQMALVGLL